MFQREGPFFIHLTELSIVRNTARPWLVGSVDGEQYQRAEDADWGHFAVKFLSARRDFRCFSV